MSSRWSKLKGDWRLSKSLQALVCNVLPSYWDIGSDVRANKLCFGEYKMVLRFGSASLSSPLSVTASIVKLGIVTSYGAGERNYKRKHFFLVSLILLLWGR